MRERFRKFQMIATLALGSAPISVLFLRFLWPGLLPWAWIYPVAYGFFCLLGGWVSAKVRLLYGILVSVASVALTILLADQFTWYPALIVTAVYVALFLGSLTIFGWPSDWELPEVLRLICVAVHLAAQLAISMDRAEAQPLLTAHAPGLHGAFVVLLLLLPFSMNRGSINSASTKTRQVPEGMRRKNTVMTFVLVASACLLSFIPHIYNWIKDLLLWLGRMLLSLLRTKPSEQQPPAVIPNTETMEQMGPVVENEISPLTPIMNAIFFILGVLLVTGILVLLIVKLTQKLRTMVRNVWSMLERYAAAVSEDYEDEIKDTRMESEGERIIKKRRVSVWKKEQAPAHPGENIRFRYRQLLRKHPQWTANTTARENMPEELAELYEQARYSSHPVTESQAVRFSEESKDL